MKKSVLQLLAIAGIGAVILSSCKKTEDEATPTATPSLYEQVGGTKMVADPKGGTIEQGRLTLRSVVDSAIYVIAGDPKMTAFFPVLLGEVGSGNTTGFAALSKNLTDFLAVATGSKTTTYVGKDMVKAHNPLANNRMGAGASTAEFDAFIADVGKSLNKNGVASTTKLYADLAALLYTVEDQVVQGGLYARVGGNKVVADPRGGTIEQGRLTLRSVVDSAIYVIAADPKMTAFFPVLLSEVGAGNTTGFAALSKNFTDFLAVATGSTNTTYVGKSMKAAHDPAQNNRMGTKASATDFDAFIGDVGKALNKNGVPSSSPLYADLANLLYSVKGDVIQK